MSRTPTIHRRLSSEQLRARFLSCKNTKEARRWQLLWFISLEHSIAEAARLTGFSYDYARHLLSRYNKHGIPSIRRKLIRSRKSGTPSLLSPKQRRLLGRLLKGRAPDGGLWTGPKVATWISQQLCRPVAPQRGWDYLKRLGYSLQATRPRHVDASSLLQTRFKKNSGQRSKNAEPKNQESD